MTEVTTDSSPQRPQCSLRSEPGGCLTPASMTGGGGGGTYDHPAPSSQLQTGGGGAYHHRGPLPRISTMPGINDMVALCIIGINAASCYYCGTFGPGGGVGGGGGGGGGEACLTL